MNTPGFSADVSLYKSSRCYIGRTTSGALAASLGITPQLPIGFCMADCDDQYQWGTLDNSVCKFGCLGNGGGGGGGGGEATWMTASYAAGVAKTSPQQRRRPVSSAATTYSARQDNELHYRDSRDKSCQRIWTAILTTSSQMKSYGAHRRFGRILFIRSGGDR